MLPVVLRVFLGCCAGPVLFVQVLGPYMLHVGGPNCVLVGKSLLLLSHIVADESTTTDSCGLICGSPCGLLLPALVFGLLRLLVLGPVSAAAAA